MQRAGVTWTEGGETDDGRSKYLITCPFNSSHDGKDACLFQDSEGKIGFNCFHDSCADNGWQQVKERMGRLLPEDFDVPDNVSVTSVTTEPYNNRMPDPWDPGAICGHVLAAKDVQLNWLVKNAIVSGEHLVIGGRQKTLKTSITLDLMVSLAYGVPFLGEFEVPEPVSVMFVSGESGEAVLKRNYVTICNSKKVDPYNAECGTRMRFSFNLPGLTVEAHLIRLVQEIDEYDLRLVVIDPIYLSFLKASQRDISMGNLFEVGAVLEAYGHVSKQTGCTVALIHHNRKGVGRAEFHRPDMGELSQSGFAEWGRQFLLLGRRQQYHNDGYHPLHMVLGGSAGHGGYWHVDVDEGMLDGELLTGKKWDVNLTIPGDDPLEGANEDHDGVDRVRVVLARSGECSKTRLLQETRLPEADLIRALGILANADEIEVVTRGHVRFYKFSEKLGILD
jgi:hypothetical protein